MNLTTEQKVLIEAGLYVAGEDGLSNSDLAKLLEIDKNDVKVLMDQIASYYNNNENYAFMIVIFDNKYKMLTKPTLNDKLMRLAKIKYKNPLTKSLMEILTIIAYNGPITKKELEKIKPGFRKIKVDEDGNLSNKYYVLKIDSNFKFSKFTDDISLFDDNQYIYFYLNHTYFYILISA